VHVDYELTIGDLVAADVRCLERSGVVRRQVRNKRLMQALVMGGPIIGVAAYAFFTAGAFAGIVVSGTIALPILALVTWLNISEPQYTRKRMQRCITKFYRTSDGQTLPGPRQLEVSEAGMTVTSPDGESQVRWHAVSGTAVANDRYFIAVPGGELVVPLRDLSNSQWQELWETVERYRTEAGRFTTPPPGPLPTSPPRS
jgi:hypothetical protein